jgi:hypothetical protein
MNYQELRIAFLTYLSRSGSTILARLLDEYDDICVTTEGEIPLELFGVKSYSPITFYSKDDLELYLNNILGKTRVASWNIPNNQILNLCNEVGFPINGPQLVYFLLYAYKEIYMPKARLVIYKACPFMPWHITESKHHFPEALYIHLIRDPRAVYYSQKKSIDPFKGTPFSRSPLKTAMEWKRAIRLISDYPEEKVKIIKYEELVDRPKDLLKKLILFLGVSPSKDHISEIQFSDRMEKVDKNLHREIDLQPDSKKAFVWKDRLLINEIQIIDHYLNELIASQGYEIHYSREKSSNFQLFSIYMNEKKEILYAIFSRIFRVTSRLLFRPKYFLIQLKLKMFND